MSTLAAFKDGDAWAHRADGVIVGRARNGSWAERVRAGVPIDDLVEWTSDVGVRRPTIVIPDETAAVLRGAAHKRCDYICCSDWWHATGGYNYAHGSFAEWDFDTYFTPVESRSKARARRTGKKAAKPPKYGPKASKAHTVAAKILAEPVEPSLHATAPAAHTPAATPPTTPHCVAAEASESAEGNLLRRFHAISVIAREWLADMADFADDVEITEEDLELERQLQRQRDARYER